MMAVLLGMAAARRGTMHAAIAKMLCLHVCMVDKSWARPAPQGSNSVSSPLRHRHIPALHPPTFTELELEVPAVVQTAALLGVGLLYQGSAHRLMTEARSTARAAALARSTLHVAKHCHEAKLIGAQTTNPFRRCCLVRSDGHPPTSCSSAASRTRSLQVSLLVCSPSAAAPTQRGSPTFVLKISWGRTPAGPKYSLVLSADLMLAAALGLEVASACQTPVRLLSHR